MKKRLITLLSTGDQMEIDPSEYRAHTNLKEFDKNSTKILRVHRHAVHAPHPRIRNRLRDTGGANHFLIYGMRATAGNPPVSAYDIAINESGIKDALARVAEHCGLEDLQAT